MSKTLNATYILEKNKLESGNPWILLFAIDIDGTDTLRLAGYIEDVTWNSETWTACPCYVESITESGSGRLDGVTVHVANVDQLISAYVENNNLISRTVTIYVVNKVDLTVTSDVLTFVYTINRIQLTEQTAAFELGHEDLFSLRLPWQRFIRDKCRFGYKDTECGYPSDEFDKATEQNLKVGGDTSKDGGWLILNSANADTADINESSVGLLQYRLSTGAYDWDDATRDGPYIYKTFIGDWDINIFHLSFPTASNGFMMVAQDSSTAADWVAIGNHQVSSVNYNFYRSTNGGVSTDTLQQTFQNYWRFVRVGPVFTAYTTSTEGGTWVQRWTVTRTDITNSMNIGFTAYKSSTGTYLCSVDWFRVTSGGLPTCDFSFDGDNGCRAHQNTRRYGGAPAIPYGRLTI